MTNLGWWLVLLAAGLTMAANLLLRIGVEQAGGFPGSLTGLSAGLLRLAAQPLFDLGVILYGLAAVVWFRVIASEPLSIAYPLLVSLTFILVMVGAAILFHETITLRKLIGVGIILGGILLISNSN